MKWPGCKADHSPPSSVKIKDGGTILPLSKFIMAQCLILSKWTLPFFHVVHKTATFIQITTLLPLCVLSRCHSSFQYIQFSFPKILLHYVNSNSKFSISRIFVQTKD
jgi:hypothetical protein